MVFHLVMVCGFYFLLGVVYFVFLVLEDSVFVWFCFFEKELMSG